MFPHPGWYMEVENILYNSHTNHRNSSDVDSHGRRQTEKEIHSFQIHFSIYYCCYYYYYNRNEDIFVLTRCFPFVQNSLGGRLRMIITGAAPTSPSVLGFLRAALGCQVKLIHEQTHAPSTAPSTTQC